ncbi:DUF4625 domain-containing protein [Flammeovirga sp. SubArs3]|uniref:DUF4625 domain-containing protein n=1 Tax=Flammeovirga sp. SubArs3 TaxID=2995316 RepID=UPI00248B0F8E|nr:DUF4625 domain-containing protein [Flammeovirga sp. SubArs3]
MKFVNLLAILSILAFASCNNETESNPKPVISDLTVSSEHDHGDHARVSDEETVLEPGGEAIVEAHLTGTALSYVQVDIHFGGDHDHSHSRMLAAEDSAWTQVITYYFGKSQDELGENEIALDPTNPAEYHFDQHIDVPETLGGLPVREGDYHFVMHLVDLDTQEAEPQYVTVEIHEDHDH